MKNTVILIVSIILGFIAIASIMTVAGRSNRDEELNNLFPSVVEETVNAVFSDKSYDINSRDEFIADFTEYLSQQMDNDCNITVNVMEADMAKGTLSIQVVADYQHPNGEKGTVSCEGTVIFNKTKGEELQMHTVSFYISAADTEYQKAYKMYCVLDGDIVAAPVAPGSVQGTFLGWVDESGNAIDFSQPVIEDLTCYARFE